LRSHTAFGRDKEVPAVKRFDGHQASQARRRCLGTGYGRDGAQSMERLTGLLNALQGNWGNVSLALLLFVVTSVGGIALASFLLVKLPAIYFCDDGPREFWVQRHPIIRWTGRILKNALGIAVVILGVLLSLPGIPGPGVLLILLGVTLVDFPGKRPLERWLASRPKIFQTINRLRQRYGKPPLVLASSSATDRPSQPRELRTPKPGGQTQEAI